MTMAKKDEFLNENNGVNNIGFVNKQVSRAEFPPNLVFGILTSSYQVFLLVLFFFPFFAFSFPVPSWYGFPSNSADQVI